MITVSKATKNSIRALSRKLLKLLEDKNSQIYHDNVAKFGIPKEYVKKAFSEKTLLEAVASGKSTIHLALENKCKILGFAQTIQQEADTTELDRIVVFPEYTRKSIGTQLLGKVVKDERRKTKNEKEPKPSS
jgi:ribosomal protein S18 acetylase RimI-like enzyme